MPPDELPSADGPIVDSVKGAGAEGDASVGGDGNPMGTPVPVSMGVGDGVPPRKLGIMLPILDPKFPNMVPGPTLMAHL
jgi:hypothetical protein